MLVKRCTLEHLPLAVNLLPQCIKRQASTAVGAFEHKSDLSEDQRAQIRDKTGYEGT